MTAVLPTPRLRPLYVYGAEVSALGTVLVSGYRLSFWVAAGIVARALAVVLLLLRGNRAPGG